MKNFIRHVFHAVRREREGQLVIQVLVFATVAVILISGFSLWVIDFLTSAVRAQNRLLAFSIAEAGVEYYRWHLAHDAYDFEDGTGGPGPYVHDYYDKTGEKIGAFVLTITPSPIASSSLLTIESKGTVVADETVQKTIRVQMGIPSLARFAIVTKQYLRVGSSTTTFGEVHSNGGIRFDGHAYNVVRSAQEIYDDPDHGGGNEFGVHTHKVPEDPAPPNPVPYRPDVFEAGREFPVPAIDFASITTDLASMKTIASSSGHYVPNSGNVGYHIVLKTDDTFDLYRVDKMLKKPPGCTPIQSQDGWGTWSIDTEVLLGNYPLPASRIIFVEDDVWVDGQINTARLTIAAGQFPETSGTDRSITINRDLLYTNFNGTDVIGLIAQKNVNVGLVSEDDLRIDAAMVAKNGRLGRYLYRPPTSQGQGGCNPYDVRSVITSYGMLGSNGNIQFIYEDEGSGYLVNNFTYDPYLLYAPPPYFPTIGNDYVQVEWEEIQ